MTPTSYNNIIENVKRMKADCGQPDMAEVTYNNFHEQENVSVFDVVKYIKDDIGIESVHVVPVNGEDNKDLFLKDRHGFIESVEEVFSSLKEEKKDYAYSYISRIVQALRARKTNKYLCEAGISSFSVSSTGKVYPCFMFTDIEEFEMGSVFGPSTPFDTTQFKSINESLKRYSKFESKKCKNCFNNRICSGCLGVNYFESGTIEEMPVMDCEMQKELTERVLVELSRL